MTCFPTPRILTTLTGSRVTTKLILTRGHKTEQKLHNALSLANATCKHAFCRKRARQHSATCTRVLCILVYMELDQRGRESGTTWNREPQLHSHSQCVNTATSLYQLPLSPSRAWRPTCRVTPHVTLPCELHYHVGYSARDTPSRCSL